MSTPEEIIARALKRRYETSWDSYSRQAQDQVEADLRSLAQAALKAIDDAGLAMVPKEPTPLMVQEGRIQILPNSHLALSEVMQVWRQMLAAVAPPEVAEPRAAALSKLAQLNGETL